MKKNLLILILFVLTFGAIQAQRTQTMRGIVVDSDTGLPLPGVNIVLPETTPLLGAMTDANGEFTVAGVPVGRYSVAVSFVGYQPLTYPNIQLESGKETVLMFPMVQSVEEIEEVIITGTESKTSAGNDMATVSARRFSTDETERYAGSLGDPSRMAANFAGVMSVSPERNDIVIRGNSPTGLLWRLDGIEIPNPNHFGALGTTGGPVSMLNNNLLTNSDFYTGAFPAEYGNATSGVFDLNMRNGNSHAYEHVFQVGFNGFEVGTEGPFSKTSKASYLANFRYSTLEVVNKLGFDSENGSSVPQYKDLTFKINVPLKKGKISLIGVGGLSFIQLADKDTSESSYGVVGTDTRFGSDMGVVGLSHVHYLSDNVRIETNLSAQVMSSSTNLDSVPEIGDQYLFFFSNYIETKYSVASSLKLKQNKRANLNIGILIDRYGVNFIDSILRFKDSMIDPTNPNSKYKINTETEGSFQLYRAFIEQKYRFTDALSVYAGMHGTYFPLSESFAAEPRAGMRWQFAAKHAVSLGAGMHSRLQPSILYFKQAELADGSSVETNRDMDFTKSNQAVFGYDFVPTSNFRMKFETYYQQLYNVPVSPNPNLGWYSGLNFGADFNIPTIDSLENTGTGKNYGIELTIEKFLSKNYYFLVTTSLYESKYKGADGIERNTAFNGNYVVNALAGYDLAIGRSNSLTFNLKSTYAGGKRDMPVLLDDSRAAGYAVYDIDNLYATRYDDYFTLDMRIGFKLNLKSTSQEWALDITNITNNKNIFRQSYNPQTKNIQTDYHRGIFPMFLYRLRF
jgi:hypothetical protein